MGIPRFFRYISETFPECSRQIKSGECPPVDNLYLDANGIIHTCARKVYFPQQKRLGGSRGSPEDREKALFSEICDYINKLLHFVQPRQTFYIAIDGCAPLAKQAQQRQRRYKAVATKTMEEFLTFDSTCITPGTRFMYELHKHLQWYIQKQLSYDRVWQRLKIVYSGPQTSGEGEHKIVNWIRADPARNTRVHCMYGLDADLFMLSLATGCDKFYLLREDQWSDTSPYFYWVDIHQLKVSLHAKWGKSLSPEALVREFIFVCFLVGNDFLHASPSFTDLAESIPFIMELRQELLGERTVIMSSGGIDLVTFKTIIKKLAETEGAAISAQFYKRQVTPNVTLNSSLKDTARPELGIDLEKYRTLYYRKAQADPEKMCLEYIQGLEWVNWYYYHTPNNWQWFYPFHYTPLLTDIVEFLENSGEKLTLVSQKRCAPILPFQQLLCVVPPASNRLLPQFLQELYTQLDFFPTEFKIDLEGKQQEWEGVALLPFVDIAVLLREYEAAEKRANSSGTRTVFARNGIEPALQYSCSNGIKITKLNF